jgi:hypothetical protein
MVELNRFAVALERFFSLTFFVFHSPSWLILII